jgi:murein DD-endopeptidase MepM/ murein hydrolase activator NlpD
MKLRHPVEVDHGRYRKFGKVIEYNGKKKQHCGYDYDCPFGTPVLAITDGRVIHSSMDNGGFGGYNPSRSGGVTIIQHITNDGEVISAIYGHIVTHLKVGDIVLKDQFLGTVDHYYSGREDIPHLHFCIWAKGGMPPYPWGYVYDLQHYVDPIKFIDNN